MPINSEDFLQYAREELSCDGLSEFKMRNASSRAYYAVFHAARQRLVVLGENPSSEGEGSHKKVIDAVRCLNPGAKSLAVDMDRLKRFRNNCDYDLKLVISEARVKKHLVEAQRVIDRLSRVE